MSAADVIYLDYAATTPVDPRVAARMADCLCSEGVFGNPASTHHYGRAARAQVEAARAQVAALIGARPPEVIFTSGATEADNLAILGVARGAAVRSRHVITARTEHKAVLDPCRQLEREGCAVTYLTPASGGCITPEQLSNALQADTILVSLMHANNETGAIQDIAAFGALCRAHGAAFHVDAAQGAGKLPIDVTAMNIDLLAFTAHKLYGPKGIGALYVHPTRRAGLQPLMFGGGHERGLRSGTLPVHQIVGFGIACEWAAAEMAAEATRLAGLREKLWAGIADLPGVLLNTSRCDSLPGILNVSFAGIEGESLLFGLAELAVASGSACNSDSDEPSYVLRALGRDRETAQSSLRFSLGKGTAEADIRRTIVAVRREVLRLRTLAGATPIDTGRVVTVSGEAGAREQGTWVRFMLSTRGERIEAASHQVFGCPATAAVCDWLVAQLKGRLWVEPGVGGPEEWARRLEIPLDRLTRLLVVEDALRHALEGAVRQSGDTSTMVPTGRPLP